MGAKNVEKASLAKSGLPGGNGAVDGANADCPLRQGTILATVVDTTGAVVPGIEIAGPATKSTGAGGDAGFDKLAPSKYTVTLTTPFTGAAADTYAPPAKNISRSVKVSAGQTSPVSFQLRLRPTPTIALDDPKIVIVKHDYHGKKKPDVKPHRIMVTLGYDGDHDGVGELSCDHPDQIKVYEKQNGTSAKALPWSIKASKLKTTVWVEGAKESSAVAGTELKLTLKNGTIPPKVDAATEKITCVLLQMDVYKWRPEDNSDPEIVTEPLKIDPGRSVLLQGTTATRLWAQRAKLVVAKAKPYDYAGKLVIKPIIDNLSMFAVADEVAVSGQVALAAAALTLDNATIDQASGTTFWTEGKTQSAAMSDSGWTIETEDLPDVEGDRITMTVLKAELELYQSRTQTPEAAEKPTVFTDDDKFDKGRYLHWQNPEYHHGRAMVVVKKIKPDGFDGTLILTAYDAVQTPTYSATKAGAPKVKLYTKEVAKTGQSEEALPLQIPHPVKYPTDGKIYWVEGATVSGALRDVELRLGVKEIDTGCDRAEFTVVKFKKLVADIPSTPAQTVRSIANAGGSNSPVARHTLTLADPPDSKSYDEDFKVNEPLVMIEDSVPANDLINLSVEIEPAGLAIPVKWSSQRDKSSKGDHKKIQALKGDDNLTLTQDGADPLKATLLLDNVGSFFIRPYLDCNDSNAFEHNTEKNERIDREPFIVMNLVSIRLTGVVNNTVKNDSAGENCGRGILYKAGKPHSFSSGDFKAKGNDAMAMDATVLAVGGGQDGLRGLDKLFGGWLNNELNSPTAPGPGGLGEDVTHHFQQPLPPVPPPPLPPLLPPPIPPPPPIIRARCFWELDGAEISGPIMDSGYDPKQGIGGNTSTGTMGQNGCPVTRKKAPGGIGQRIRVTNVDSPGGPIRTVAASDALATLRRFKFNIDFQSALMFWTNRNGVETHDDFPACRLYVTVQTNTWGVRLESTFDDAYVETIVTPQTIPLTKDGDATRRATPLVGSGFETRQPDGCEQLQTDVEF